VIYAAAILSVAIFLVALWSLRIIGIAAKALEISRHAVRTIRDPDLSDEDKERILQKASVALLGGFLSITLRTAAAIGTSLLPMLAFDVAGLASFWVVVEILASWEAIILFSVSLTLVCLVWRRN
jgi:hypothetical protein